MIPRALGKSSPRWFESSRNVLSKPCTSNLSGLRPRRDNGFYFLAHSEKPSPRCIESSSSRHVLSKAVNQ